MSASDDDQTARSPEGGHACSVRAPRCERCGAARRLRELGNR